MRSRRQKVSQAMAAAMPRAMTAMSRTLIGLAWVALSRFSCVPLLRWWRLSRGCAFQVVRLCRSHTAPAQRCGGRSAHLTASAAEDHERRDEEDDDLARSLRQAACLAASARRPRQEIWNQIPKPIRSRVAMPRPPRPAPPAPRSSSALRDLELSITLL